MIKQRKIDNNGRATWINKDTLQEIEIAGKGTVNAIASHHSKDEDYLRAFVKIPDIIKAAIYIGKEKNTKKSKHFNEYKYYVCGVKIGNNDYTLRISIGNRNGNWYYDHTFSEIKIGDLVDLVRKQASLSSNQKSPYGFIDNRLLSLLQEKMKYLL